MTEPVIRARGVSKKFVNHAERATSLKERLVRRTALSTDFYALRDVDLDVLPGTTVGLIGANGSGKSTLLKVLAGIIRPSTGTAVTRGRIASLLELGAGFNGELTGRENVYLNASLLGLTRRETDEVFDDILRFSELEEFIDNPVKHYSSGMYVRLGFAVAVHVDPEILLVDEVLAVGDEHFAQKCLRKIKQFQDEGRTILFVSHGLETVEQVCDRAVVLDHGRVVFDGDPYFGSAALRKILGTTVPLRIASDLADDVVDDTIDFRRIEFTGGAGEPQRTTFRAGDRVGVRVEVAVGERWRTELARARAVVMGVGDIPIWSMTAEEGRLPRDRADWTIEFEVAACPPLNGRFVVAVALEDRDGQTVAVARSRGVLDIRSGKAAGLLSVPYVVPGPRVPV